MGEGYTRGRISGNIKKRPKRNAKRTNKRRGGEGERDRPGHIAPTKDTNIGISNGAMGRFRNVWAEPKPMGPHGCFVLFRRPRILGKTHPYPNTLFI